MKSYRFFAFPPAKSLIKDLLFRLFAALPGLLSIGIAHAQIVTLPSVV